MMIGRSVIDHFTSGKVDEIHVVYNYFVNMAQQEVRSEVLLPFVYEEQESESLDRLYEPSKDFGTFSDTKALEHSGLEIFT